MTEPLKPAPKPPPQPTRPECNNWRARLRAESDEHKYARLGPCEWETPFRKRMRNKRNKRTPRPTDGQGKGLPPHPDIPF